MSDLSRSWFAPDTPTPGPGIDAARRIDDRVASVTPGIRRPRRERVDPSTPVARAEVADLERAAEAAADLLDPAIMDAAWRCDGAAQRE